MGKFVEGLLSALAGRPGLDLGVFAITWRMRPELERQLPPGSRLIGRPMPARPLRRVWEAGLDVPAEWFTGRLDVLHGTNSIVPPTRRAARVVTVHDLSPLRYPEVCEPATLAYPDFIRRAIAGGAFVHTDSEFVAAEVTEAFGAPADRVRAIHPGIPPLADSGRAPDLPFPRYVLAIGTVEPRKDYPGLLRAFDELAGRHPDVGLVIVGADAWGASQFAEALSASPHRDRVVRPGYLSDADVGALLRAATVLAYPSRYEGFGFPPLQAMAAGVPVVATAAGSILEVVGDAAAVVPVGDSAALAEALERVLDDHVHAEQLGRAGRERAARFTWEALGQAMVGLYEEAVQSM